MERTVRLYIGNAAKFDEKKYYILNDYTVNENGQIFAQSGEPLKESMRYGYKYVQLIVNGKNKWCKVHRIVACTFTDICGEFNEVVNHLDENKLNNCASNLKWTTNYENIHYGTIRERRGQTVKATQEVRNLVKQFFKKTRLKYTKNVKIKRLKHCYKILDSFNNIVLYTVGMDITDMAIDEKRGGYRKIKAEKLSCKEEKKPHIKPLPKKPKEKTKKKKPKFDLKILYIQYPIEKGTRKSPY